MHLAKSVSYQLHSVISTSVWVRIGCIGRRVITWVSVGSVVRRGGGAIPIGSPRRAPGHAGKRQWRERHADNVDKYRGRAVGARQVTLQHPHIESQQDAVEMRALQ